MARYIDAEAFEEHLRLNYCKDCNSYNGVRCSACEIDDALDILEDAPTADVVEVVRCKDCDVPHNKWLGCPNLNGLIPSPDFYCAKGTPKERGADNG